MPMPRLIPNPAGDLWRRVDTTLASVDPVLTRVDKTLVDVDQTLSTVAGTLGNVETILADATSTLSDVRALLVELESEMKMLHELPALIVKIDEIHRAVGASS